MYKTQFIVPGTQEFYIKQDLIVFQENRVRRKFSLSQKVFSRAIIFRSSENQQSYLGERNKIKNRERKEKKAESGSKNGGRKGDTFYALNSSQNFYSLFGLATILMLYLIGRGAPTVCVVSRKTWH